MSGDSIDGPDPQSGELPYGETPQVPDFEVPEFDLERDAVAPPAEAVETRRRREPVEAAPLSRVPVSAAASEVMPEFVGDTREHGSGGYRVWTGVIFGGLALLLAASIALMVWLATNVSMRLPFGDGAEPAATQTREPVPGSEAAGGDGDVAVDDPVVVQPGVEPIPFGDDCFELCLLLGADVPTSVPGAPGAGEWVLSRDWRSATSPSAPVQEIAGAEYMSQAGALRFTVWKYADDAAAEDGFRQQGAMRGEPDTVGAVYEGGVGTSHRYSGEGWSSIVWVVPGAEGQPWVMAVDGPADDAVWQFYLNLPI